MLFTYKLKPGLWFGWELVKEKLKVILRRGDVLQGVSLFFSDCLTVVEDKSYDSVSVIFKCHGQALWDDGDEFLWMTLLT